MTCAHHSFGAWTLDFRPWTLDFSRRPWPSAGTYEAFLQSDLLVEVRAVLKKYERWNL